ncbi:uncharacterized protein LOC135351084 isoform X2 [Halichondria panicea]|uniref:uncharacterized protein LOC135351084 isoform X2 n=1 Tax=Halichondria panicea TaxID=6063 RepID=UPI00312B3D8E
MKTAKMKKLMFHLGWIVLTATSVLTTQSEGADPSVSLTVEGGGSLVGEQCPGTVKILCYGINLSLLRWRYNGNIDILRSAFPSDTTAPSSVNTNNPAFVRVELLSVAQDPANLNFANFSSELVVNVSNLRTESVTNITCGDPGTSKMIPVDVEIIQQTEPESPIGMNVTALYEFGSLTDAIVSWKKLETRCPEFQTFLIYQVTLLGSGIVTVNHTSCGEVCIVNFQNFSDAIEVYRVSLFAVNAIGASELVEYPAIIVKQSSFYFTPTFLSNDCLFVCECFSNGSLDTDSCNVLYATDSMYRDPMMIVSPLNTQFEIAEITTDRVYFFEFSVSVNGTLVVRNRLTEKAISSPRFSTVVIVFLALTILLITVGTAFVICVAKQLQGVKAKIVLFMVCLFGMLSLICLIVFFIITGVQQDTCSLDWSRARDALVIVAFLFALFGNALLVCFLLVSCQQKKSGRMNLQFSKDSQTNMYSISEQTDAIAEGLTSNSKANPEKTNTASGAKDVIAPSENMESSKNKKSESKKFTVYKVVVRLEDRWYLVFRRYPEFETLFGEIKKVYPSLDKLPGKKVLKNKFDPNFIDERRIGLRDFIINLMNIPDILEFLPVREFLAINDPRSALPINDEPVDEQRVQEADRVKLGEKEDTTAKITDLDLLKVIRKGTFVKVDPVLYRAYKPIMMYILLQITYHQVYLGRHKETGAFYTIKVLQKEAISEVELTMAKRNIAIHPFLVGLHYSFQTRTKLYFLLEYVNGGKLLFHLQRQKNNAFDEPSARFYAAEITSVLGYLHSLSIIYWDLKLENILLDANGHIMLTDFGLCKEEVKFGETVKTSGTPEYLAPEVLRKQEYGYSVDWWCLGVVIYEMMYGLPPFFSEDVTQRHTNIIQKSLKLHTHICITSSAQDLLESLLQKDKNVRLGDHNDIKFHSFFKSINWDALFNKRLKPPFIPSPVKDALKLGHFGSELTAVAISDAQLHGTEGVPCVSIADDTFNVMN